MEYQHGVVVDRLPERAHRRSIERPCEIHAADLADKERMKLPNFHDCAFPLWASSAEDRPRPPVESIGRWARVL